MELLHRSICRRFALAACVIACAVLPLWAAPVLQDIHALEAANRLDEARARLEELKRAVTDKTDAADKTNIEQHLGFLDGTLTVLAASRKYQAEGYLQRALDSLNQLAQKLADPREAYLALAVHRRITEVQSLVPADAVARARLTRADTLFAREEFKAAREAYTEVVGMTDPISDDSKARARRGLATATQKEFENQPVGTVATVFQSMRDGLRTVSGWLLTFVAFGAPLALLLWIVPRLLLKNERSLELVDLGLGVPSPSANRELTQELQDVIKHVAGAGPGSAKLDATGAGDSANEEGGELPAPDLVFITAPVEAPEFAKELGAFVSSTPTIQVGGIGFNPQQLWALIKRLLTPRARHAFTGTLTTYDNRLTLRLTREDRLFGTRNEWRAFSESSSTEARISCLVDIASRIVLDGDNASTATSDCGSLKAYILGLYALGANTPDAFKNATAHFQAALDRDEKNWLARFQLALCARGRKDTRSAIKHLTWFTGSEALASPSLQDHVKRYPDFPYVVQYQLASTLSLASEDREDHEVGRILDGLIALETSEAGKPLNPAKRLRLVMLARSGQSTRDAVRCALERDVEGIRQARQRLREHLNWFDQNADALQQAAPSGHPLARGIVLHAYGRTQFSTGDGGGAIESLTEAVELMPTYADVHVDLAKAYLERKSKANWPQRVTTLLDRALALDPANAKARFVYARFYFAEETRDFAKAEPHLTAAPFDPASLFMLAQVLNNRASYADTLGVLERAIALKETGPPFRVRLYAESLLELVKLANDPNNLTKPNPHLLERSRRQLCEYDKLFDEKGRNTRNYQRAGADYAEICALLKVDPGTCFQSARPPSPQPAAAPAVPAEPTATGAEPAIA